VSLIGAVVAAIAAGSAVPVRTVLSQCGIRYRPQHSPNVAALLMLSAAGIVSMAAGANLASVAAALA